MGTRHICLLFSYFRPELVLWDDYYRSTSSVNGFQIILMPPMVHVSVLCFIVGLYDRGWRVMRRFQRRKERKTAERCYDRTVFATRHKERIINLIETSFNASQTEIQTVRPTYMDKNGTWKTVALFLSRAPLHYMWVRVLCSYYAFSVSWAMVMSVSFKSRTRGRILMKCCMCVMLLKATLNS